MAVPRLIESVASATEHRDRDDLDGAVARLLFEFLHARAVTVYRVLDDGEHKRVARRVSLSRDGNRSDLDDTNDLSRLPRLVDVAEWRECELLRDAVHYPSADGSLRSLFPLIGETDVVGLLEIEAGEGLRPREASLAAGIVRILRNHLALLDYGERDTLTGLRNRKTFEASFGKLRSRAGLNEDLNSPSSWLGVVDIDRFKAINDSHGHLFGDEVLLLVARVMQRTFKGSDQLFRFGGEEFVVVLDRADAAGARVAFERLRAAVESFRFPQVGNVTICLGYTHLRSADGPGSCFERADAAMYYAKNHGRNQVQGYEMLVAAGLIAPKEARAEVELF